MNKQYVELRNGAYRIVGSRVSLDSIVYAFRDGEAPESIRENFPVLSLEQVHGAIAYYLAHQDAVDAYLKQGEAGFQDLHKRTRRSNSALNRKLREAQRLSVRL